MALNADQNSAAMWRSVDWVLATNRKKEAQAAFRDGAKIVTKVATADADRASSCAMRTTS